MKSGLVRLVREGLAAMLLLGLGSARVASAQTVTPGHVAPFENLGGVRYRSFANTGGKEVYLGVPDLGVGTNRVETDFVWSSPASHTITFSYDQTNDKLTTTVVNQATSQSVTLNYPNFAAQAQAKGKKSTVCDLDVMQITVANRDTGTTVKLEDVFLDGHPLGTFDATPPPLFLDWMVTNYDFGHGFTLTGKLTLAGTFGTSQELSRVEIKVGRSTDPGGVAPDIGPLSSCNDNEACTTDSCSATLGCQHVTLADSTTCDDGSLCTTGETCQGGVCGTPTSTVTCSAQGECYDAGVCNPLTGVCSNPPKASGAVCGSQSSGQCDGADTCDGAGACQQNQVANGTGCDDTDSCTGGDTCTNGVCQGTLGECGDGTTQPGCGEQCDDGNTLPDDGCSATCMLEPCGPAPATGCLTSLKTSLAISKGAIESKDKVQWTWKKGPSLTQQDFADPSQNATYALCMYGGPTNTRVFSAVLAPNASWKPIGTKGYKFKGTSTDGLTNAVLKGGAEGKSSALMKGKGEALTLPSPQPLTLPLTVQLKKEGSPLCLESVFTSTEVKKNDATKFKAKK